MDAVTSLRPALRPGGQPRPAGARRAGGAAGRPGALAALGLTRTAAAELADGGGAVGSTAGSAARRPAHRRQLAGGRAPPPAGSPRRRPVEGMRSFDDATSWWSTSQSASPTIRGPVGTVRRSSAGSPPRATASPRPARRRRASCTAATRPTTGVMVVAKSERAYTALKTAFKERTVEKGYHALVQGHPDPSRRHDRRPIDRHPRRLEVRGRRRRAPLGHALRGDRAFAAASLPGRHRAQTGRTHRIRVLLGPAATPAWAT